MGISFCYVEKKSCAPAFLINLSVSDPNTDTLFIGALTFVALPLLQFLQSLRRKHSPLHNVLVETFFIPNFAENVEDFQ